MPPPSPLAPSLGSRSLRATVFTLGRERKRRSSKLDDLGPQFRRNHSPLRTLRTHTRSLAWAWLRVAFSPHRELQCLGLISLGRTSELEAGGALARQGLVQRPRCSLPPFPHSRCWWALFFLSLAAPSLQ
jgi:hypothetical protein